MQFLLDSTATRSGRDRRADRAGGSRVYPQPAGYLRAVREMCDEAGVFLICDEVATASGHRHDVRLRAGGRSPDFMCVAKGLTGGYCRSPRR